jgi:hypothetical protein
MVAKQGVGRRRWRLRLSLPALALLSASTGAVAGFIALLRVHPTTFWTVLGMAVTAVLACSGLLALAVLTLFVVALNQWASNK